MLSKHDLVDVHKKLVGNESINTWSNGSISTRIDCFFLSGSLENKVTQQEVINKQLIDQTDHNILSLDITVNENIKKINKKTKEILYFK